MKKKLIPIAILALASGGCTFFYDGKPVAAKYDPPAEYKFKSITHWGIVANDVANRAIYALNPPLKVTAPDGTVQLIPQTQSFSKPIYISVNSSSKFGKVFASQLKSSFLSKGVSVSTTAEGAQILNFKVDVVTQSPIERPAYTPGTATALAAGVLVMSDVSHFQLSPYPSVLGITGVIDGIALFQEINKRPHTEIAVTTTAVDGTSYLIHMTDTYYIDTPDASLYEGSYPQVQMDTSSDKPLATKTLNVNGN